MLFSCIYDLKKYDQSLENVLKSMLVCLVMIHTLWNHLEAWKVNFSICTVNVMDGNKHVPFLNVKANKIIIQVQMNQKIGWHTRYDLDLEVNLYLLWSGNIWP